MVYDYIKNPFNGANITTNSKEGRAILRKYISVLNNMKGGRVRQTRHKKKVHRGAHHKKSKISKSHKKTPKKSPNKSPKKSNKKIHIHQIYFDWGAKKPPIFIESEKSWRKVKGGIYKCWGEKDLLKLLEKYPKIKKLYHKTKYPIQKVDLMRWVILYDKGGLYCDMDVINRSGNLDFIKRDTLITKYKGKYETDVLYFENPHHEVFQGKNGEDSIFDYFEKNLKQINKKAIYKIWKGRYILQTFGPYAVDRYLKERDFNLHVQKFQTQFQDKVLGQDSGFVRMVKYNSPIIIYKTSSWMTKKNNVEARYIPKKVKKIRSKKSGKKTN